VARSVGFNRRGDGSGGLILGKQCATRILKEKGEGDRITVVDLRKCSSPKGGLRGRKGVSGLKRGGTSEEEEKRQEEPSIKKVLARRTGVTGKRASPPP